MGGAEQHRAAVEVHPSCGTDAHRSDPVSCAEFVHQLHNGLLDGSGGSAPGVDLRASARTLPSASTTPAATLVPPMSIPIASPRRPKWLRRAAQGTSLHAEAGGLGLTRELDRSAGIPSSYSAGRGGGTGIIGGMDGIELLEMTAHP